MTRKNRWPILMGLFGIALVLVGAWTLAQGFGGWYVSFQGPGSVQVEIPEAGDYRLWHESRTTIDGRVHVVDDDLPSGASIEISDRQGQVHSLRPLRGSMSQEVGTTRRVGLGHVEIPEAGTYSVTISGFEEPRSFRISEIRFFEHFLRAMVFAVPGSLLVLAALIWLIIGAIRRR